MWEKAEKWFQKKTDEFAWTGFGPEDPSPEVLEEIEEFIKRRKEEELKR